MITVDYNNNEILHIMFKGNYSISHANFIKENIYAQLKLIEENHIKSASLDYSEIKNIDSSGLQILIMVERDLFIKGVTLTTIKHSDVTKQIFELVNLEPCKYKLINHTH